MKKNKWRPWVIFMVMMGLIISFVSSTAARTITLKAAIDNTLKNSHGAGIIRENRKYAISEADKVVSFARPWLENKVSYYEMGTTEALNPFIPSPDRYMEATLEAGQVVWAGGRIPVADSLRRHLRELADLSAFSDMAALQREVSRVFVTVLYHKARLQVFRERLIQRKDEKRDAEDLFEAGMVTHLDVREATLNLHMAADDLQAGESEYHTALVDFNLILGTDAGKTLVTPQGNLERPTCLPEALKRLDNLYEEKNQLDMQMAAEQLTISRRNLKMVEGERMPTLALMAGGDHGGEKQDDFDTTWYIGAQVTWSLLDGGIRKADLAGAQARISRDRASLRQVSQKISGTLNKLTTEVDRLGKRILLQEENIELSHENYQDARALYGAGTMTLTRMGEFNLLDAEARFNLLRLYYLENLIAMDVTAMIHDSHETDLFTKSP